MTPEEIENAWKDEQNWKLWQFYYCKSDPRMVVPRRWKAIGWSLNYAHPGVGLFILFIFAVLLVPQYIAYLKGCGIFTRYVFIAAGVFVVAMLSEYLSSPDRLENKLKKLNHKEKSQQHTQD